MTEKEKLYLSAFTGYLLIDDFSKFHKFAEEILQRPIFTHEFANDKTIAELREATKEECERIIKGGEQTEKITLIIPHEKLCKSWTRQFGMNAYYAGKHWTQRQKDAEYWHTLAKCAMREAGIKKGHKPFEKPVVIKFYWNDKLDLDNHSAMGKMIVDGIKGRIIENDSRRHIASVQHFWHDGDFIKVEIEEFKGATE